MGVAVGVRVRVGGGETVVERVGVTSAVNDAEAVSSRVNEGVPVKLEFEGETTDESDRVGSSERDMESLRVRFLPGTQRFVLMRPSHLS